MPTMPWNSHPDLHPGAGATSHRTLTHLVAAAYEVRCRVCIIHHARDISQSRPSSQGASELTHTMKTLEDENRRLKKLLVELMLDVSALTDLLGKN
jgi:hypothetical protein